MEKNVQLVIHYLNIGNFAKLATKIIICIMELILLNVVLVLMD